MMRILPAPIKPIKYALLSVFILMQIYLFFLKKHDVLGIEVFPNDQPTPHIFGSARIGQTFIARENRLTRIDVMMGTYDRRNDKDITFELKEAAPEKRHITSHIFNASLVMNNLYNSIKFPLIADSRGKTYYFLLYSQDSTLENSVVAWMNSKNIYEDGDLFIDDTKSPGDLVFRIYSSKSVYAELNRILRNQTGPFNSRLLLIASILLFAVIQVLLLLKFLDISLNKIEVSHPGQPRVKNV